MGLRVLFAMVAVVSLVAAGCSSNAGDAKEIVTTTTVAVSTTFSSSTSTAPTTTVSAEPARIFGVWRTSEGYYQTLSEDWSWTVSETPVNLVFAQGTFTVDDDVLTFFTTADSEACPEMTGIYQIALSEDGDSLGFERIEDKCSHRSRDLGRAPTTRIGGD